MTTCTECKQPLSGHWHTTSFPVETLCCPCAKAAGYLANGCPEEAKSYPIAAQPGLPGVGPDHAQAEMLLRAESAPKGKPPTQTPRGQFRLEM